MPSFVETLSSSSAGADLDLDEVWSRAMEEYEQTTGSSLKGNLRGFDAVSSDINERLRQSKAGNKAKAQQIMGNVMKCLQRFGGIVAQATSVVFGPSAQCWNALSFVISAAQGYQAVLDGFAALMERCTVFLERLNIDLDAKRKSGIPFDSRLRKDTYKVIAHFFTVLGHSHKLATSKRQKVKTVFKIVLFNDDSGVKDSLSRLETLVRDLTDTKVSVILQDVQGLARYVRDSEEEINRNQEQIKAGMDRIEAGVERTETAVVQMHSELSKKLSQDLDEKNLAKISKVLRLAEHQSWQERHQDYSGRRVPGTGDWLLQPGILMSSWADINRNGLKVMALTGPPGHGKSHLASFVIDYLLERYPRGSSGGEASERVYVAYYYFQNSTEEGLAKCLGSIILQFARSNRTYAQAVANICSKPEGLSTAAALWQKLVINLGYLIHGTSFLVIDDLRADEDAEHSTAMIASLANLAQSTDFNWKMRLFVTARAGDPAVSAFGRPGVARIVLGERGREVFPGITRSRTDLDGVRKAIDPAREGSQNEKDVFLIAQARINAMCARKPYLSSTLQDTTLDAALTLAKGVKGDYSSLQLKLDQIEVSDSAEDVLAVINQASEDPVELLCKDVAALNESLTSEEIQELNDLLLWVTGAFQLTTLTFLEAAIGDKTLWLRKHIPQKFYRLLRWDERTDVVEAPRSSDIVKMLEEKPETAAGLVKGADASNGRSRETALSETEIQLVQRVVKTFCGDELFDKFNFGAFFQSKIGKRNARIQLPDKLTLHARILRRCLESFSLGRDDEYFEPLRSYAAEHFISHLAHLDLTLAGREELRAIGAMLAELLTSEPLIRTWWAATNENFSNLEESWILEDKNVRLLKDCMKHPLISAGFRDDGDGLQGLHKILDEADGVHSILENVAKVLTKDWFEDPYGEDNTFFWAFGIMAKTWNLPWTDSTVPGAAELVRFATWAGDLPNISVTQAHWNAAIASNLSDCGHNDEALAKCLEVDLRGSDAWSVLLRAAQVSTKLGRHEAALEYLCRIKENYLHRLDEDAALKEAYWLTLLWEEAHIHWHLENLDEAEACFSRIVENESDPDAISGHKKAMNDLFELWDQRKAYCSVVDRLQRWTSGDGSSKNAAQWFLLLHLEESFHNCLVSTAANHEGAIVVCESYERTLAGLDPRKQRSELMELRHHYATAKYHGSTTAVDRAIAFDNWEDVIFTSGVDESSATMKRLCPALLDEARMNGLNPLSAAAAQCADRLENVAFADLATIQNAYESNDDPRLTLIRLHCLAGNDDKAKELATTALRSMFDDWPTPSDSEVPVSRFIKIGQILNVFGDDSNAIAAWSLLRPKRPEHATSGDVVAGASELSVVAEPTAADPTETSAAKDSSAAALLDVDAKADDLSETNEKDDLADLTATILHWCDGCEREWKAMGDAYICKDCLNCHLCSACHGKLKDRDLHVLVCRKDHEHLYIPPFDRERWERMDPETMMLGDDAVPHKSWLDGIREQWSLQQDRIDEQKLHFRAQLQAAKVLTKWRRALLKVRAATT